MTAAGDEDERRRRFGVALSEALSGRGVDLRDLASGLAVKEEAIRSVIAGELELPPEHVFETERLLGVAPGHLSSVAGYIPVHAAAAYASVEDVVVRSGLLDDEGKRLTLVVWETLVARHLTVLRLTHQGGRRHRASASVGRMKRRRRANRGIPLEDLTPQFRRHLQREGRAGGTVASYTSAVEQFRRFLSGSGRPVTLEEVAPADVEAYLDHVLSLRRPATAVARYRALCQFFRWMEEEGDLLENPMVGIEVPVRRSTNGYKLDLEE